MDTDGTWNLDTGFDGEIDFHEGYWTTRDRKTLKIELMESSHIQNTINLLKRNLSKAEDYDKDYIRYKIDEFEEELKKRDVYKRHLESKGE